MRIKVDSREQKAYDFLSQAGDIEVTVGTLNVGDYSIEGLEDVVALERKSLPDLIMCLGTERARFEREMLRARGMESFAVVVEANWQDMLDGKYRSAMHPAAAAASIQAFSSRYRIPFFFTGSRKNGEAFVAGYLRQFLRGKQHEYEAISKAVGSGPPSAPRRGKEATWR